MSNLSTPRTVLVTGVSRGLGLAIAENLIVAGYRVVGLSRSPSDSVNALLAAHPAHFFFEPLDLGEIDQIHPFAARTQRTHGRFYGLVNNAGIGLEGVLATMHEKDIARVLQINLAAPILLCKYFSRGMIVNRCGSIVNVSSIIASTGFSGLSAYGATKAGLIGLTKSLSRELGKVGVRVNAISPGYMETEMTIGLAGDKLESIRRRSPFQRFPSTSEVADAVRFLLSEQASGIHGANLTVDLGSTA